MTRSLDTEIRCESDFNEDYAYMFESDEYDDYEHFQSDHREDYAYSPSNSNNGSERTTSDPIKFKLKRTNSEIQLMEDEEAAEYRDYCMFLRIAGGMISQQNSGSDIRDSLDSVIRTHHDMDNKTSSRNKKHLSRFAPMPGSPDDMPWLERTPSTKAIYDFDKETSLRGGTTFAGASAEWLSQDSTSSYSRPLPSLVDLVGRGGAAMDCDLSIDDDGIFILDL